MLKISALVPIYNCEKYVEECLDSILSQSFCDFELIIVDDGSNDDSSMICDKFAEKDDRVTVIHKKNGGVSSARNAALKQCSGEYICFIDSDDFIALDYLKTLLDTIGEYDCVGTGTKVIDNSKKNIIHTVNLSTCIINSHNEIIKRYADNDEFQMAFLGPVAKLYKAEYAKKIEFDIELKVAEDIVYNLKFLSLCNKVKLTEYVGYYVRKNFDSTTQKVARKYNPMLEHGWNLTDEKIDAAKFELGLTKEWINNYRISKAPFRFFDELINPYCDDSPYSNTEAYFTIKKILDDREFINKVRSVPFSTLPRAYRLVKLCAYIKVPFFSVLIAKSMRLLMKNRNE